LFLSGCLLTRLYAFKKQFCDYREHFSFTTEGSFRVNLAHPILLDKDVIWLAGAVPSRSEETSSGKKLGWRVDKVLAPNKVADPEFDRMWMDMDFIAQGDAFLLQQVNMDQRFSFVVDPDLMDRNAQNVCRSKWLVLGKSGEIDLGDADLSGQPGRQEIMAFLGQPTAFTDNETGMLFEYRLQGSKFTGRQYSFEFWHDPETGELLKSTTTSIRFSSTTDFVQKKMWIQVR
jgi:hypothetical protein